jgi:hypothetical protein
MSTRMALAGLLAILSWTQYDSSQELLKELLFWQGPTKAVAGSGSVGVCVCVAGEAPSAR